MKYFIDFEATQYSNEIISIGCVREDGETFYSLVNVENKKMTNFITKLTGITKEDIRQAPSSDEVFSQFHDWVAQDNSKIVFYCYGFNDIDFVRKNLSKANCPKAQMVLSILMYSLIDYSKSVMKHFGLIKPISLIKVLAYYRQVEKVKQSHDALEDAYFLKEVYEKVHEEIDIKDCPFPEYTEQSFSNITTNINIDEFWNKNNIFEISQLSNKKEVIKTFSNTREAVNCIIGQMPQLNKENTNTRNVAKKILNANNQQKSYFDSYWKITRKETVE